MAITVKYNGTSIEPKPNVGVSQNFIKTGDGRKIGVTYNITLSGTITSTGTSTEARFRSLLTGAKTIRSLFKDEGKLLEIKSTSGGDQTLSFYTRVTSIEFPDSQYISTIPYTVQLEADCIYSDTGCASGDTPSISGTQADIKRQLGLGEDFETSVYVNSVNDNWAVSPNGTLKGRVTVNSSSIDVTSANVYSPVYTVTHTLSATGKRSYGLGGLIRKAWENAELWCLSRVGIPSSISTDFANAGESTINILINGSSVTVKHNNDSTEGYGVFNYTKTQDVSQTEGTYSITETFTLAKSSGEGTGETAKGNVMTTLNVDTAYDENAQNRTDGAKFMTVTINGTITGLESRSIVPTNVNSNNTLIVYAFGAPTQTKGQAALAEFESQYNSALLYNFARKLCHNGDGRQNLIINQLPISRTSSINDANGVISFTAVFNTRQSTVFGTIAENGTWSFNRGVNKYAIIEVPNKPNGPVVQNIGTKSLNSETMSIDITMGYQYRGTKPFISESAMRIMAKPPTGSVFTASKTTTITTSNNETWNPQTGKFTKTITRQWMNGC